MRRISIAVHGRFHAFDLAAALLRAQADVQLLTNYPRKVVTEWFPPGRTRTLLSHGLLSRTAHMLSRGVPAQSVDAALKRYFGRWAARAHGAPDVAHCWSGIAEETLLRRPAPICTVSRGSAHIAAQDALLREEEIRVGAKLERPSRWLMLREQREYALADRVIVPSAFARNTFTASGVDPAKVRVVNLSLRATGFIATTETIRERAQRIRSGQPLRIVYAGTISYRKGMHDLEFILERLHARMHFRITGALLPECREFARRASGYATLEAAVPQQQLPQVYAWGDIFILPSIEDGFAVVLAQAQAAGLPILTTANCGGPDIIAQGGRGWAVPARAPEEMVARLQWCDDNRAAVADMVEQLHEQPPARNWDDVAADFMSAIA